MSEPPPPDSRHESGLKTGRMHPLDWARWSGAHDDVEDAMNASLRRRRRQRKVWSSVAAACAVALLSIGWWPEAAVQPVSPPAFVLAPPNQTLPDGSTVEFGAGAKIAVEFSPEFRRVVLSGGSAHFEVTENPSRPFLVEAGGVVVRAVGTAFEVRVENEAVDVLVTKGRVAVNSSRVLADGSNDVFLDVGDELRLATESDAEVLEEPVVRRLTSSEMERRQTWRVPQLQLDRTPLAEVIGVINGYSDTELVLADPALGKLELSGRLRANNVSALLQILHSSYAVAADTTDQGSIVLRKIH